MNFSEKLQQTLGKSIKDAANEEIYAALLSTVKEAAADKGRNISEIGRKVYYISAEFLIGKLLSNNLINLGVYDEVRELLAANGKDICEIEEVEPEPSLGNGGLGRLAACLLDSIATLDLEGDGIGLNYHLGLFKQIFENHKQKETPNPWIQNTSWLTDTGIGFDVPFKDFSLHSKLYDIDVTGYENGTNKLHLFDIESVNENIVGDGISFDKNDIRENLTLFLYPDDSDKQGELLRIYQQYFMVSNGAQFILKECEEKGYSLEELDKHVVIQINDTHPSMVIPELIRLLTARGISMDKAIEIVTNTCAYTNHTILAEALEKWPIDLFSRLLPRIYQIIQEIDRRFIIQVEEMYPGNEDKKRTMGILRDGQVRMANLAIVAGYSVNGVARLHTEILKKRELQDLYEMMPEKFNNKTNGITQRRFLLHGNPLLADWVTDHIGDGWITDLSQMSKLKPLADDPKARAEFMDIKYKNKERLAKYILEHNGVEIDPRSIYDVQVKRLHEYKRQLLNILHVMYLYNQIKEHPEMSFYPRTFIFGAKASAGYVRAKEIIKLINSVADVVNNDLSINGKLKVVFIEDYRVSNAEWIFAAADVSEQISTASKEASGTGNMKFMLNGAPTLGTMDGANVEIVEEVGIENAFIFGLSSDEVINYENNGGYNPQEIYFNDWDIKRVVDQLMDGTYSHGDHEMFRDLYNSLLNTQGGDRPDRYFILKDFRSYAEAQKKVEEAYKDPDRWAKMALLNTASCGKFTSDRTIQEYVDNIWKLDYVTVKPEA